MIISASRRTDIPSFYTDWLIKRLEVEGTTLVKQKYSNNNYIITIKEDEQVYFYAMKNREPLYCALIIKCQ